MAFDHIMQGDFAGLASENGALAKRPYISTNGRNAGHSVITVNTGQLDNTGQPIYAERRVNVNATLRKDEWINLDNTIIEAARERLVIVDDLMSAGLTYNVGGLGTMIAEWETASEVTDARITMDGDTVTERDKQEFGLNGVPIPLIHKDWRISERALLASRTRGAALDVTTGQEMARAVARTWEGMVFNGGGITTGGYSIPGLTTFASRETYTISDWSDTVNVSPEDIHTEILEMVQQLETSARAYGPFTLYVPGAYAFRFRQDFKEFSDKTLMERVTDEDVISRVRFSDVLATGNVVMVEMTSRTIDLAMAADVTTVQWQSGSGFTNHFKTYAASAPRLKADFDGRCGILHGSTA
ncbi:MAG: putative major capsid protein [Prokaryotic dsDNA virus sp.]|nr:MAG: putative major capsid protein [Prokaryotic dsDNA virus sp.]|tara:strand:+ start:24093 stop:25163 length:1071 start_codon:yes stop_codon:yes gene_type:complete